MNSSSAALYSVKKLEKSTLKRDHAQKFSVSQCFSNFF